MGMVKEKDLECVCQDGYITKHHRGCATPPNRRRLTEDTPHYQPPASHPGCTTHHQTSSAHRGCTHHVTKDPSSHRGSTTSPRIYRFHSWTTCFRAGAYYNGAGSISRTRPMYSTQPFQVCRYN